MKIKKLSLNVYLIFIILFLFLILLLPINNVSKRKAIEKSFLTNTEVDSIYKIELQKNGEGIELIKDGSIWFVKSFENINQYLPVDSKRINKLMYELIKSRKMYKIINSDKVNSQFSIKEEDSFYMTFTFSNKEKKEIVFGSLDFSQSSIYFIFDTDNFVYESDYTFDSILKENEAFWYEPYLLSKELSLYPSSDQIQIISGISSEKKDRLLDLRHSGFYFNELLPENLLNRIFIMTGDGNHISLKFYKTSDEQEIGVQSEYENKLLNKTFTTKSKISLWTYSQLFE